MISTGVNREKLQWGSCSFLISATSIYGPYTTSRQSRVFLKTFPCNLTLLVRGNISRGDTKRGDDLRHHTRNINYAPCVSVPRMKNNWMNMGRHAPTKDFSNAYCHYQCKKEREKANGGKIYHHLHGEVGCGECNQPQVSTDRCCYEGRSYYVL